MILVCARSSESATVLRADIRIKMGEEGLLLFPGERETEQGQTNELSVRENIAAVVSTPCRPCRSRSMSLKRRAIIWRND